MSETPKTAFYELWKHLNDNHCITLVDSELDEVVRLAAVDLTRINSGLERDLAAMRERAERAEARVADLEAERDRAVAEAASCAGMGGGKQEERG